MTITIPMDELRAGATRVGDAAQSLRETALVIPQDSGTYGSPILAAAVGRFQDQTGRARVALIEHWQRQSAGLGATATEAAELERHHTSRIHAFQATIA